MSSPTTTMFAWQSPASSQGLDNDLVFNPSAPMPPEPKKGPFTLVKVLAASINPADIKIAQSSVLSPMVKKPLTPGLDFVGTVAKTTDPSLAEGDLVVGAFNRLAQHGALAKYLVAISGDLLVKLDPSLRSLAEELACAGVAGITAVAVLSGLNKGDKVFINGSSGGTGTFCVQVAKHMGLNIVATCSSRNAEMVKGLGADVILDYTKLDVLEALVAHVNETGVPFARAIDNAGSDGNKLFYQAHQYLAPGGEFHFNANTPTVGGLAAVFKMFFWPSFLGGGKRKICMTGFPAPIDPFKVAVDMIVKRELRVVLDEVFELEKAREAYKKLKGGHARGKIVVRISN